MKKSLKIIIVIILLLLSAFMFLIGIKNNEPKEKKDKIIRNAIDNIYYNEDITRDELEKQLNAVVFSENIFYGQDSVGRSKPSSKIMKENNLEEYEKIINDYYKAVEEKCKNNTKYTIIERNGRVYMTIIPWYFFQYSNDLIVISTKLMEKDGYDFDNEDYSSTKYKVNEYKARAIAIRILNDYLDYYDNTTNEEQKLEFEFNGNKAKKNEYYSLYLVLSGFTSDRSPAKNPNYDSDNDDRLEGYINDAINNHVINADKPLKIS